MSKKKRKTRPGIAERMARLSVPEPNTGCHIWIGDTVRGGYGRVRVHRGKFLAHRVAWELANGPIPPGFLVMHRCDNPPCVNPAHLTAGTEAENIADRQRKGRQARGDRHARLAGTDNGLSVLRDAEVREIRELCAAGMTQQRAAEQFGVAQGTVSRVVRRAAWRHVA